MHERFANPPVVLPARILQRHPLLVCPGEIVLRIVQKQYIDRRQLQPVKRARKLVVKELGGDTVPDARSIFDDIGEAAARLDTGARQLVIAPLQIPRLGDDHYLLPHDRSLAYQSGDRSADEPFAPSIGIVGGGIDQIYTLGKSLPHRLMMPLYANRYTIASKARPRDTKSGAAKDRRVNARMAREVVFGSGRMCKSIAQGNGELIMEN